MLTTKEEMAKVFQLDFYRMTSYLFVIKARTAFSAQGRRFYLFIICVLGFGGWWVGLCYFLRTLVSGTVSMHLHRT